MKKTLIGIIAGLVLGAGATAWWLHRAAPAAEEKPAAAAETEEKNPLHLAPDDRRKAGIVLAAPQAIVARPQREAYGRVIDPSPLIAGAAEVATAKVAADAADRELARVRLLHEQGGNASGQALETAEAAAATAAIQWDSARARLRSTWGPEIASRLESGWIARTLKNGGALARLDVLPGDAPAAMPESLSVVRFPAGGPAVTAEVVTRMFAVDSYLLVLRQGNWPVGTGLRAQVPGPGAERKVLTVPRDAVVYHEGSAWVYVLGEKDTFERHRVVLGPVLSGRYAVDSGVEADDQVVVTGAQQLLSNELQAGASED